MTKRLSDSEIQMRIIPYDRWLVYERCRVNHGYGNYDDWRDEET
jgi:hypothetical protein